MTNNYDPQDDRLPSYGEAGYGQAQQPGAYGQPQSGAYGPPPGTYGTQPPGTHGTQPPGTPGAPQPGTQPPGAYGQPQPGPYGQPRQPDYGRPQDYVQPQRDYGYGGAYVHGQGATRFQPYGAPPAGYAASQAAYQPGYSSPADYARWLTRVAAYLVDSIPQLVLVVIAIVVLAASKGGAVALLFAMLFYLAALGVVIYNRWIRAGRTGQSWGKQVVGVRLIDEETRQPVGALMAFVRDLAHVIDGLIFYIGYLFPLWDQKRQTIADKIMHTVVVSADGPYSPQGAVNQRGQDAYPPVTGQYPQSGYPDQGGPQAYPQRPGYSPNPGYPLNNNHRQAPGYPQGPGYGGEPPASGYPQGPGYGGEPPASGYPQGPGGHGAEPPAPGYPPDPGYGSQR